MHTKTAICSVSRPLLGGEQIATQIGAKLNPATDYEHDVCIYVKPGIPPGHDFKFEGKKSYLDIIDGWALLHLLEKHPEVSVIACSRTDYDSLLRVIPNTVVLIPQHHCNFERVRRSRTEITTVGCIGTTGAFPYLPSDLKEQLKKRGMNLIEFSRFYTRQDIVDFYQKIDIQIVWRPYGKKLANPLKIVNAASFGIPTIALDEPYFHELQGYYFPVRRFEEFLARLDSLRSSPTLYADYQQRCFRRAEEYHIETIGKLYKNLCTT